MQAILGAGGAIGTELAKALSTYTTNIRLVSRHPKAVNPGDELMPADLTDPADVQRAVAGAEVVYLTVGFAYDIKVWRIHWPDVMRATLEACRQHGARLVFFDNVYMYDPDYLDGMTENTPIRPSSKKSAVRAEIAHMLLDEVKAGRLTALIARCADFYGPGAKNNSMLAQTVLNNLSEGKKANWMGSVHYQHSFTYTPDAGRATALLGNSAEAYNQVWHLPTAAHPPTGKEWITMAADALQVAPKYQVVPKMLAKAMGLLVPIMRELAEMMYQYDRNYVFDSSKFEQHFSFQPTPYQQGLQETIAADYAKQKVS